MPFVMLKKYQGSSQVYHFVFVKSADGEHTSSKLSCYRYMVVNICSNRTHACQLDADILSTGIKQGTLLFELPSYIYIAPVPRPGIKSGNAHTYTGKNSDGSED